MTAPWGTGPWGTGPWGGPGTVSIAMAYATSTNDVVVVASGPLLARSIVLFGDASNPSSWQIVRQDTGKIVPIVAVTIINPSQVVLRTQFPLPQRTVELEVDATNVRDVGGNPLALPRTATFAGVTEQALSTPDIIASGKTKAPTDILNRSSPTENGSLSGTLIVKGGDYAEESGAGLLRKLIIRRLVARPGDFYHLPTYGVGLRVKQPVPAGDLMKLQTAIKQQIMFEPDVASVKVTLTQSTNLLFVQLAVVTRSTGQTLDIGVPFQTGVAA